MKKADHEKIMRIFLANIMAKAEHAKELKTPVTNLNILLLSLKPRY